MTNRDYSLLTRDAYLAAAKQIDKEGWGEGNFGKATKYGVVVNGTPYPSKLLSARAWEHATGRALVSTDFRGYISGPFAKAIQDAGFEILDRKQASQTTAKDSSRKIVNLPKQLTLIALRALIKKHGDSGGVIRIKKPDKRGEPLNFRINTEKGQATSGFWKDHLPRTNWILVYRKSAEGTASVWVGLKKRVEPTSTSTRNRKYRFHLESISSELRTRLTLEELTGLAQARASVRYLGQPSSKLSVSDDEASDIEAIKSKLKAGKIDSTTAKRLIDARKGQGAFRKNLLKVWRNTCAVSGIGNQSALRASHIKPWRDSTDAERLSPSNGIILSANLDALFDKHLISFATNGKMKVSSMISKNDREKLGIPAGLRFLPTGKEFFNFLDEHSKKLK